MLRNTFLTAVRLRSALLAVLLISVSGCISNPTNPDDPWEPFNREVWRFNEDVDRVYLKPVSKAYKKVVPAPLRRGVGNFFRNLLEPTTVVNDLLQGKISQAFSDTGRFLVNSTIGLLGFFDVATKMGLERHQEDFGQTFAKWGIPSGPYLVLPFIGPSNARDGFGLLPYYLYTDPRLGIKDNEINWGLLVLDVVDRRAQLLSASRILELQLDPYAFTREAYRQKRLDLIYDGNPPLETEPAGRP